MKNGQEKEDHYNMAYTSTKNVKRRKIVTWAQWAGFSSRSSA
jgi:hypothetical protein